MRAKSLLLLILLLLPLAGHSADEAFYGRKSLAGLRMYGLTVRVLCTGALEQHRDVLRRHIEERLGSRNIAITPAGSVILKLVVNSIQSDDGFVVAHMSMFLSQTSYLGTNNKPVDATTWDAWKMGEYREEELLQEVDDLTRQFMNDYIAAN